MANQLNMSYCVEVHGVAEADAASNGSNARSFFIRASSLWRRKALRISCGRCELGPYARRARKRTVRIKASELRNHVQRSAIQSNQRNTLGPVEIFSSGT